VPSGYDLVPVVGNPFRRGYQLGGAPSGDVSFPFGQTLSILRPETGPGAIPSAVPQESLAHQMTAGAGEAHPAWIGQRLPSPKNFADEQAQGPLKVDLATMQRTPEMYQKNVDLIRPNLSKEEQTGTHDEVARNFIDHIKSNLLWLYDQVPQWRDRAMQWYDGGNKIVKDRAQQYGLNDSATAGVYAALSPQKDWFENVSLGDRVLDMYHNPVVVSKTMTPEMEEFYKGSVLNKPQYRALFDLIKGKSLEDIRKMDMPDDANAAAQAMWMRLHDEAHGDSSYRIVTPEGNFGDVVRTAKGESSNVRWATNDMTARAIRAIQVNGDQAAMNLLMGERHKVRNFYNNLLDPNGPHGDITIDTHAVAAGLLRPLAGTDVEVSHNFHTNVPPGQPSSSGSAITGVKGTYPLYAQAYREAAEERGILPRQMQSVTWEAVRGLFPRTFKSAANKASINNLWEAYRNGKATLDQTRQAILEAAGGIKPPAWHNPAGGANALPENSGYATDLQGLGALGAGARRRGGRVTDIGQAYSLVPVNGNPFRADGGAVEAKKPKNDPEIRYQWRPHGNQWCGRCSMFRAPDACSAVAGKIARQGWCKIWRAKAAKGTNVLKKADGGGVEDEPPSGTPNPLAAAIMQHPVLTITPPVPHLIGATAGAAPFPHTPEMISPNQKVDLGTVFRGTEAGVGVKNAAQRVSQGDLGTGVYVTPQRWLAESYGGGPQASMREGTREVHQFNTASAYPEEIAYVFGGARFDEPISIYSGNGIKLWEGPWSGKNIDRVLADHPDIKAVVGTPNSIGLNQIAIRHRSMLRE